ncbi:protein ATP6V1FNB-like [Hyla sarda]|uniref:protein ATP6V1FNB-like n=1 Tax=Hyla sarda TaxID=327740 RepID=UPI0024C38930|nr:protein ATP6V1FNB-like [Hyla sarda]
MRDLLTTRNQNCWKELIEKETLTRMTWKIKYNKDHPNLNQVETTRKRREVFIPKAGTSLPPLIKTPPPLVSRTEENYHDQLDILNLSEMRPVTRHTSRLLYDGFSKEGKGRSLYLKVRKESGPEEKYPHPVLSSWDYGWRLGDVMTDFKSPIHGRSRIVKETFYSRNGILSVPSSSDRML